MIQKFLFLSVLLQVARATYSGTNTFNAGTAVAYSTSTTVTNPAGCTASYPAGATVTYPTPTYVTYPAPTTVYGSAGPVRYNAGTTVSYPAGSQVSYGPGTSCYYPTRSPVSYKSFNGNTACIVKYQSTTTASYSNSAFQPAYYPAGTNSQNYYNPGGNTAYGTSGPQVNSISYVRNNDGTSSSVTCTGYTQQGWPTTTVRNQNTGATSYCTQTGPTTYSITNSNGVTSNVNTAYSG